MPVAHASIGSLECPRAHARTGANDFYYSRNHCIGEGRKIRTLMSPPISKFHPNETYRGRPRQVDLHRKREASTYLPFNRRMAGGHQKLLWAPIVVSDNASTVATPSVQGQAKGALRAGNTSSMTQNGSILQRFFASCDFSGLGVAKSQNLVAKRLPEFPLSNAELPDFEEL
jgi:hypothetical protein